MESIGQGRPAVEALPQVVVPKPHTNSDVTHHRHLDVEWHQPFLHVLALLVWSADAALRTMLPYSTFMTTVTLISEPPDHPNCCRQLRSAPKHVLAGVMVA